MLFEKKQKIGNYTVTAQLKQGAYAETYRVKDADGKLRFLKLISTSQLNAYQFKPDGKIIEVEVAKALSHKNLCGFVEASTLIHGGKQYAYIVAEFVSGETVAERMSREDTFSVYDAKLIIKGVLRALSFLHSLEVPVIHNEVTIQNTLLDLNRELSDVRLIDFGHSRFLDLPPSMDDIGNVNPFIMAPERFNGVCSVQSDLFSVGAMMYQMLFGILPWFTDLSKYEPKDQVRALLARRRASLRIPDMDVFELDDQLINIMAKAMANDSEDRFQSAEEFIKAIDGEIIVENPNLKKKVKEGGEESEKMERKIPKGEGFAAIAGMQELKDALRNEVINVIQNAEEYARYGLTLPNGMLLYGPPGCGKTFFAKHFAEEVCFNYMEVKPGQLKSKWVNASQENIDKMFAEAEKNAPTIIFIDEMNELTPNRDASGVHEMSRSAVNEMLAQMDRTGEKGVFVIGATNYPHMIDPAILRAGRLDKKYYVGPPDKEAREKMFAMYLQKRPYDFGIDYSRLADLTEGFVSADLKQIIDDASLAALKLHSKITQSLLEETIKNTLPSLSAKELEKYERIKAEMKGESTQKNDRPKIGF